MAFGKNNDYINEIIRLGFDCNEKCLFCNYVPNKDIAYFKLDYNGIKEQIDNLYKKRKKEVSSVLLSFSGGEPCLWGKALIDSIKYAKNLGFGYIQIQTNATIISNSFAKKLKEAGLDEAFISLHSINSDVLKNITLLDKSLELTIKGIKNIKIAGIDIVLSHVLNKLNYKDYPEFIEYIFKNNISNIVSLGVVQPHGYAEKNLDKVMVDYRELVPYMEKGNKLAKKYGINIGLHYCSIPLCIYENTKDNLEYEVNDRIIKGETQLHDRVKLLKNDKVKLKACSDCFYDDYCFGVWKKYVDYFGENSIKPKKLKIRKDKYKRLELYLGWKCNQKCFFCVEMPVMEKHWDHIISNEEIAIKLIKFRKQGYNHITFLGGEPTIQANYLFSIKLAKRLGYKVLITTNALMYQFENFSKSTLQYIDELIISIHSVEPELQKTIAQTKNYVNFDKVFKNISKYGKLGMLKINTVFNKKNIDYLEDIFVLMNSNKIREISLTYPEPQADYYGDKFLLENTLVKYQDIKVSKLIDLSKKFNIILKIVDIPICIIGEENLKYSDDYDYSTRLKIDQNLEKQDRDNKLPRSRILTKKCRGCKYENICWGVHKSYFDIFGDNEINKI